VRTIRNYVDGRWIDAVSGETCIRENPADVAEQVVESPRSTAEDVHFAAAAAAAAFDGWRRLTPPARANLIGSALDLVEKRSDELALAVTLENGKILPEARGEVARSLIAARFLLGLSRSLDSRVVRSETAGVVGWSRLLPLGVAATITPWNYPVSCMLRKAVSALLVGNTLIHKPAEITPLSAAIVFEAFEAAGIPPGVANLVLGPGDRIGPALATASEVRAISFTGSTQVGESLAAAVAGRNCKLQLEMGGKNALVVLEDADLEEAVEAAVFGAFTCSGQWCAATSRVIVEERVRPAFVRKLAARVNVMRVGDGRHAGVTMGPLVSAAQYAKVERYVSLGKDVELATSATIGATAAGGYFVAPMVFDAVPADHPLATDEIFGPVVSVIRAQSAEDAFRLSNMSRYGLTASVYTSSLDRALTFIDEAEVGRVAVNLPTAFGELSIAGGGFKDSGRGAPEGGEAGLAFFGQPQAVFLRGLPMNR
jgi:aldehyde dehydrogenase (NAD+)